MKIRAFQEAKGFEAKILVLLTNENSEWAVMIERELLEAYLLMFAPCSPPLEDIK